MAGVTIGTLVNSHNLEVYFTVPDNTLSLIEKGHNKFTVEFEVYKGIKLTIWVLKLFATQNGQQHRQPPLILLSMSSNRSYSATKVKLPLHCNNAEGAL